MKYEVIESKGQFGEWRVEAIDQVHDGQVYVTLFSGPDAMGRAEEYAKWKNAQKTFQCSRCHGMFPIEDGDDEAAVKEAKELWDCDDPANDPEMNVICDACHVEFMAWAFKNGIVDKPFTPDWTSPPGDTIRDIMREKNIGELEFELKTGILFDGLLDGSKPITADIAEALAFVFGSSKEFWMRREERYRNDLIRLGKVK